MTQPTDRKSIVISVIALTVARIIVNMTKRFPYPFTSSIAGQLGVSVGHIQGALAAQAGVGLSSPLFGPFSERYGRKRVIIASMVLIMLACMVVALAPNFWVFAIMLLAMGLGKYIYDPAGHAYLGDRVPYQRRGLAMGTLELSWALSLVTIAPLGGYILATSEPPQEPITFLRVINYPIPDSWLTTNTGFQMVFVVLAFLSLLAVGVLWRYVGTDYPGNSVTHRLVTPADIFRSIKHSSGALASVVFAMTLSGANEVFFINYGVWMSRSFDLELAALGAATTVIALAEVLGEISVIGLADRFGKKRMAATSALVAGLSYVALPIFATSLTTALIGLFVMFLSVEIAIVSSIPLFSEVLPNARAVVLSSTAAAAAMGRLGGAAIGSLLLAFSGDFVLIGFCATGIGVIAWFTLWRFIHEA